MQIRNPEKSEIADVIKLADSVFRNDERAKHLMGKEFPILLSEKNKDDMYCCFEDNNRPVSLIGLLKRKIMINELKFKVASIGSVCTDSAFRGKGIAGQLLKAIDNKLNKELDFAIISGDGKLYKEFGARKIRNFYSHEVTAKALSEEFKLIEFDEKNIVEASDFYSKMNCRFERDSEDFKDLYQAFIISYWVEYAKGYFIEKNRQKLGYVIISVFDKAKPFGVIKEFAGIKPVLLPKIAAHLNQKLSINKVIFECPKKIEDILIISSKITESSDTFKIMNLNSLKMKIISFIKLKLPDLEIQNDINALDSFELIDLIFNLDSELINKFSPETSEKLKTVFPLQFPQIGLNYQ